MKITIVTISYNQAQYLERCLRSVLDQDYENVEYIVADAGSTDGSLDIIEKYRNRIDKVLLGSDDGPADGLNKCFRAASGDVLGYVNSDDALLSGTLSEVARKFAKMPSADIIIGNGYIADEKGNVLRHFQSAKFTPKMFVLGAGVVMQQSTFFRHDMYKKTEGFNIRNKTSWDAELLLDMVLSGASVKNVNRYWSVFTIHDQSITGKQDLPMELANDKSRYFELVMDRPETSFDAVRRKVAWFIRWLSDPLGAYRRLLDKLIGPPSLKYPLQKNTRNMNH